MYCTHKYIVYYKLECIDLKTIVFGRIMQLPKFCVSYLDFQFAGSPEVVAAIGPRFNVSIWPMLVM